MLSRYIKNLKLVFSFKRLIISIKPFISLSNNLIKYNKKKGYKDFIKNKTFIKRVF